MTEQDNQDLAGLVEETIRTLYDKGIAAADLAPLVRLRDAVIGQAQPQGASAPSSCAAGPPRGAVPAHDRPYDRDGRRGKVKASGELMARASAIIDVMVQGGQSPEHAAQTITRQLLSVGIQLPEGGGDVQAWKRLLTWRTNLIHYKPGGPAWDAYCAFREQLAHIPPDTRMRVAVGERLWDQRQLEFSSADIA